MVSVADGASECEGLLTVVNKILKWAFVPLDPGCGDMLLAGVPGCLHGSRLSPFAPGGNAGLSVIAQGNRQPVEAHSVVLVAVFRQSFGPFSCSPVWQLVTVGNVLQ